MARLLEAAGVMLTRSLGVGVGFIWLTKLCKGNRGWNIFFWYVHSHFPACPGRLTRVSQVHDACR